MSLELIAVDTGIYTVASVFTPDECQALIERAEQIGFEAASVRTSTGAKMMTEIRNNDRVVLQDAGLAELMYRRIEAALPELDQSKPCGVDDHLRFYRYIPGQQFKRHKDGSAADSLGRTSKLSYLIYLNGDCDGGATV